MFTKFRSSLHAKVHDAKINRFNRQASGDANPDEYEYETSSASSSSSDFDEFGPVQQGDFAVEFGVLTVVDLRSSPMYFYVCIGEKGELTSRKKKRGIQSSSVYHSKSPSIVPGTFILPTGGILLPEVTLRFCKSSIVGADSFLGECMFPINTKENSTEFRISRLIGGSNASVSVFWRIVPYEPGANNRRCSKILPIDEISSTDRLVALMESVNKCMQSLILDDEDSKFRRDWLIDLISSFNEKEIEFVILRVSLEDLAKAIPLSVLLGLPLSVQVRARVVKAAQMARNDSLVTDLITECPGEDIPELKFLLNRGGDKFNLVNLVFGASMASQSILDRLASANEAVILSEIEQVVYSPLGSCKLWPEGPIPGFRALYECLAREIAFISSKPISFQSWTHRLGMHDAPVLAGAKSDLYALRGGMSKLHAKVETSKFTNWGMYKQLYPNSIFFWFGSNREFANTLMTNRVVAFIMENRKHPIEIQPKMFLCGNFIQATLVCYQQGYLSGESIELEIIPEFQTMINNMEKSLKKKNKKHRNLIRDRLVDLKRDLHILQSRVDTKYFEETADLVDSLVLTPIEQRSPCLTNHSPSPDTSLTEEGEFVIRCAGLN